MSHPLFSYQNEFMKLTDNKELLNLCFLGPKGEQRKLFQEMVELINNDMIFWRRNFHPKDPPAIAYRTLHSEAGQVCQEQLVQSLVELLADLKMDLPFFSPRYLAHMTADVSMPGLLGYYAGLLYNANNVSAEASPVTLKYELEVGRQFAKLAGYDEKKSFGHITSGGTVANFESVFYNKASRFLPCTMGLILHEKKVSWPSWFPDSLWTLINIPLDEIPSLISRFLDYGVKEGLDFKTWLNDYSPAELGDREYWSRLQESFNEKINDPVIIVPSTAHYSWSKAAHLFGLGRNQCLEIKIDRNLSMCVDHLSEVLKDCRENKRPIIQTVCVLGTTEFGSFDPLHLVMKELQDARKNGLYTPVHIDAAYGGYFKAMFTEGRNYPTTAIKAREELRHLSDIFDAFSLTDSFTVDPHKLGHTPYGAGVFVTKHGFTKEFVAENADYCLTEREEGDEASFPLGKYILEGSKPGASATSVYFSNKMIPLDSDGYGTLLFNMIKVTGDFHTSLLKLNEGMDEFSRLFEIRPLTSPQSNLVCFYVKPSFMHKTSEINRFNLKVMEDFFPKPTNHIQNFDYFVSKTKLKMNKLSDEGLHFFNDLHSDEESIQLIRLVFLNQWSTFDNYKGISYLEDFLLKVKEKCMEIIHES